jgi:hypothetical protein
VGGCVEDAACGALETELMCANLLRAFPVGKALTSDGGRRDPRRNSAVKLDFLPGGVVCQLRIHASSLS